MRRKIHKSHLYIVLLILTSGAGFLVCFTGLVDYIPRLRVQAKSPDGKLIVSVYQERLFPRPFFPRMGAIAQVSDKNGNLVYEKLIYDDDDWDDTVGNAFNQITFEADEIRIGPGAYDPYRLFIIKRSDLALKK